MPSYPKTTGLARHARLRAHRPRARRRRRCGRRQGDRLRPGAGPARAHHRGVPGGPAAAGPRARGLQPERLGPHAGLRLLGAPAAPGRRLGAGDLEGDRARRWRSRTFASTTSPPASRASATCGSPFCPRAAASAWTDWAERALGCAPGSSRSLHSLPKALLGNWRRRSAIRPCSWPCSRVRPDLGRWPVPCSHGRQHGAYDHDNPIGQASPLA